MTRSSALLSRFRAELLGQVIVAISGALLTILLARLLGPDDYGLLFLAISVFGILELFTKLGIAKSAARYISEYKEQKPSQIRHIIKTSIALNFLTIILVSFVLFVSYQQLATLIGEPDLAPFLLLGILYLIFGTLAKYVRYVLQGFEDIESAAIIHALDRGSRLFFAVGFVVLGYGAFGALSGYILSFAIATALGFWLIYGRYYRNWEQSPIEKGLRRRIAEYTVPLTATSTANVLDKRVDTVLVGVFLSPVAVGYYTISKQVIKFIEKPVEALGFALSPTYGSEKANNNIKRAAQIYETALVNSLLLYVPAAAGLVLVAEPLVKLAFGGEYLNAVPVLQVFGLYAVLQAVTKITSNGLDFLGRARERAIVKGVTSVLNVILNIILIPTIGVVGAAIATVITYSMYTVANVYIAHTEFNLRCRYLFQKFTTIVFVTGIMSIAVFVLVQSIGGWLSLVLGIFAGVSIWGVLSLQLGLLDIGHIKSVLV